MARIRKCAGSKFHTGVSVCELDYDKIKAVVLTRRGVKLDYSDLNNMLEQCHAGVAERCYPFKGIINWEPNGGEAQTSQVGYGPTMYNGMSARTDAFTLDKFRHYQRAEILKNAEEDWDAYYIDMRNNIYGLNDGTETLAGIPVNIYPSGNDHPGASDKASLVLNVVYVDVEEYMLNLDVHELGFNANNALTGLMPVELVKLGTSGNEYKLVEHYGGGDCTAKYGEIVAQGGQDVIDLTGLSAVTYDSSKNTLTITGTGTAPKLKDAATLFENSIFGIEQYTVA